MPLNYKNIFDDYQESFSKTDIDLRFWQHFLNYSIEEYWRKNPVNGWINQSGYSVYNIQPGGLDSWLHVSPKTYEINIEDLKTHSADFFTWVNNLSILRIYNAVELLMLRAIQVRWFSALPDPALGKRQANQINAAIKNELQSMGQHPDTTNNRHLLLYLSLQLPLYKNFLQVIVREDWNISYAMFIDFFSVLRNVVAHDVMLLSCNTLNTLRSLSSQLFDYYFDKPDLQAGFQLLHPKPDLFLNFLAHANEFAGNTLKYIAGETDFKFVGLYKA